MTGPESQASVHEILDSAAGLLTDNRANIATIVTDARTVVADMTQLSKRGVSVVNRADKLMAELATAGGQVKAMLAKEGEVTRAVAQTGELIGRMNMLVQRTEGDLDITMTTLRETSANLSDFSISIKDNPSLLFNNKNPTDDVDR